MYGVVFAFCATVGVVVVVVAAVVLVVVVAVVVSVSCSVTSVAAVVLATSRFSYGRPLDRSTQAYFVNNEQSTVNTGNQKTLINSTDDYEFFNKTRDQR